MAAVAAPKDRVPAATTPTVVMSPPTIGTLLDDAMNDVEKAMDIAANKADAHSKNIIKMYAFRTISNLKASYEVEILNTPSANAGTKIQRTIGKVNDIVDTITTGEPSEMVQVAQEIAQLQEIPAIISFVTDISPEFIAVGVNPEDPSKPYSTKVTLAVSGKFPYGDTPGYATLSLLDKNFPSLAGSTQQTLKFEVEIPNNIPSLDSGRYTFLNGTLKVSYPGTGLLSYFSSPQKMHRVLLGMQPTSPGAIKILRVTPATPVQQQKEITINGTCGKVTPTPGWKIVPRPEEIGWSIKASDVVNVQATSDELSFTYENQPHITLKYKETQVAPEKLDTEVDDRLGWGGTISFTPTEGGKISEVMLIDSGKLTMINPGTHHPYVQVTELADKTIQVTAVSAEALNAPAVAPHPAPASKSNESDNKESTQVKAVSAEALNAPAVAPHPAPASKSNESDNKESTVTT